MELNGELVKAKVQVMARVPYVQKQKADGLRYTFAGEAAFIEKLHPAMVEAGLTIAPEGMVLVHHEAYKTASGAAMNRVIVQGTYRLSHVSGQSEVIQCLGEGADSGDKAVNKAMTGAYKYALRQSFLIETGNDPDDTPSEQLQRAPKKAAPPRAEEPRLTGLKILAAASEKGTAALELAWTKTLTNDLRAACKEELAGLKRAAAEADQKRAAKAENREPVHAE